MKIILITIVSFLMIRCGTDQGETKTYNYTIKNNSNLKVELVPYFNGIVNHNQKKILQKNEIIDLQKKVIAPYNDGINMTSFFTTNQPYLGSITHIEVVFDNSKKVIYQECTDTNQCFNQPRNIFNPIYNDNETEVYTITTEDYQNATDCNGNCY